MVAQKKLRRKTTEAVRWEDLTPSAQKETSGRIANVGRNMPDLLQHHLETHPADQVRDQVQAGRREALVQVQPYLRPRTVTGRTAANRRVETYGRAVEAAHAEGHHTPAGAGWYFEHHRAIRDAARGTGFDTDRAIVASAVMSPENSPENERAAVGELMRAHSEGKIKIDAAFAARLRQNKLPVSPDQVGREVSFSELHPKTVAGLSLERLRDLAQPRTNVDLKRLARGGTKANIVKAVGVLRGAVGLEEAIDPQRAPKEWSYAHNTRLAVPDTAQHHEYMSRVIHQASHHEVQGQQMLDLWGLRKSNKGILSKDQHTAEDTWQNAITYDQPNVTVPGTRTNALKVGGSLGLANPAAATSAEQHAFNNRATRAAAAHLGKGLGYEMPAVAVQEVDWTQVRREAGKDPGYGKRQRTRAAASRREEFKAAANAHAQMRLF